MKFSFSMVSRCECAVFRIWRFGLLSSKNSFKCALRSHFKCVGTKQSNLKQIRCKKVHMRLKNLTPIFMNKRTSTFSVCSVLSQKWCKILNAFFVCCVLQYFFWVDCIFFVCSCICCRFFVDGVLLLFLVMSLCFFCFRCFFRRRHRCCCCFFLMSLLLSLVVGCWSFSLVVGCLSLTGYVR